MRIPPCGSLAVQLIRHARFDPACLSACHRLEVPRIGIDPLPIHAENRTIDRVLLSPWTSRPDCSLNCDSLSLIKPPALAACDRAIVTAPTHRPQPTRLTPVIGSPALSGLGVALIVPGTLLDVVA